MAVATGKRYLIIADSLGEGLPATRVAGCVEAALRSTVVGGADRARVKIEKVPLEGNADIDMPAIVQLESRIAESDIVIACDRNVDELSLEWHFTGKVAELCRKYAKPLDIICSTADIGEKLKKKAGISNIFPLSSINGRIFRPDGCGLLIAGCDEAGRGCLAGPVFAAAVILPEGFYHPMLNDSKQLTAEQRTHMRMVIEQVAPAWKVVAVSPQEIDRINILNASIAGMKRALDGLGRRPDCILVDGNRFGDYRTPAGIEVPHHCIVKGDARCAAIAAASILAKTHRDEYMTLLAKKYPQYGWDRNMAYPTADHKAAIEMFGLTPHHRKTYKIK